MKLSYELDKDHPTQLGLVVLQSDETLERDMRWLLPPDVELLVSRVPSGSELDTDMIAGMEGKLTQAAQLLPRGAALAAIGYGCTSASAQIGSGQVAKLIRKGAKTQHVTDPAAALIAACHRLGIRRIGLISPYVEEISTRLRVVLADAGIFVQRFGSFNESLESNVVRISQTSLRTAVLRIAQDTACEALFLSCTNLRTLDVIDDLEEQTGLPVLASNQVLAWHLFKLAGITPPPSLPGRLWRIDAA